MMTDFSIKVRVNGWTSDLFKFSDFAKEAESLADQIVDLDFNVSSATVEFIGPLSYPQLHRFYRLLNKGRHHVFYHAGRTIPECELKIAQADGTYVVNHEASLGHSIVIFLAIPTAPFQGDNPAEVKIVFGEFITIKNQGLRGNQVMANVGRLANALEWSIENEVKLSGRPVTLKTWNTITIYRDNPWKKDETTTPKVDMADIYSEE
jgi:hypothetical protein